MINSSIHQSVLLNEVLTFLNPQSNQTFVDCTFGGGGHALAIIEKIKPDGMLIGIDWDPEAVQESHNENLILVNDNYRHLDKIVNKIKENGISIDSISGALLDLGLSSDQLSAKDRGFSFSHKGPLDLRYNRETEGLTGADILKTYGRKELFKIFSEYGDEPLAGRIADVIIEKRQIGEVIETADMLVQLVSDIYRKKYKSSSKKSPATKVFQALRIAVNDELGNLKVALPRIIKLLAPGGRLAVISFHSGEDRIVKNFFRELAKREDPPIKIITKKPITPSESEIKDNPRSRSSKLRVIEKT